MLLSAMKLPAALALALIAWASSAAAEERNSGFWGALDFGYASMRRDFSVTGERSDGKFAMAFRGGYFWHPRLLLGIELSGWTLENSDLWNESKGEGLATYLLVAQAYPLAGSPLFLRGGVGTARYWNNRPLEHGGDGSAGVLGVGYDFRLRGSSFLHVTPIVDYAAGKVRDATTPPGVTQDFRYRALTFRIGITYR